MLAFAMSLATARRADACGAWSMRDLERKLMVSWQTSRAAVRQDVPHGKQVAEAEVIYDNDTLELLDAHGRPIVTADSGSVRHAGAALGRVRGEAVTVGTDTFTIDVSPTGKEVDLEHQTFYWFTVHVTSGDRDVLVSDAAMGLCSAHEPPSPVAREHQRAEITARVVAYLGWRAAGM